MSSRTNYLLIWDHKHGNDYRLYTSYNGAKKAGVKTMRETCDEWGEDVSSLTDDELWDQWPKVSGETEFFSIEELSLED